MSVSPTDAKKNPFGDPLTRTDLFDIESSTDFWNRTPQLQLIHQVARRYHRMSAWGLLAVLLAHRASHVSPNVVLVEDDGTEGESLIEGVSLNIFAGITARPGGGKSRVIRKGSGLLPPKGMPLPDGTGQGIVKQFGERKKISKDEDNKPIDVPYMVTRFLTHSLTIHAPEVTTLNAEFAREGSKTAGMMRSMWMGETVGMTNADTDRAGVIAANMGRIAGIWGVQPKNPAAIMAQAADGTPQRFLWAPAEEYRTRPEEFTNVAAPPPLTSFPFPVFGTTPPEIAMGQTLPSELKDGDPMPDPVWIHWSPQMAADIAAMRATRDADDADREEWDADDAEDEEASERDEEREMEAHLLLMRIKIAVWLGWLWGHGEPDDVDWFLSGVVLEVMMGTAAGVWQVCRREEMKEATRRGHIRGLEQDATNVTRETIKDERVITTAELVYKKLAKAPMRENGVKRELRPERRQFARDALRHLEDNGRAEYDGTLWYAIFNGKALRSISDDTSDALAGS